MVPHWTNLMISIRKLFGKIKPYFVIIVISRYSKYTCHIFKNYPLCCKSRKRQKSPSTTTTFKVKTCLKVVSIIIFIFDFTFIIEISLIFFHADDQTVDIFEMRFLNLVHCVCGGKISYKVAYLMLIDISYIILDFLNEINASKKN